MINRLRRQFTLFVLIITSVIVAASVGFIYSFTKNSIDNEMFSFLLNIASNPERDRLKPGETADDISLLNFSLLVDNSTGEIDVIEKSRRYDLSDESMLSEVVSLAENAKPKRFKLQKNEKADRFEKIEVQKTGDIGKYKLRFLITNTSENKKVYVFVDTSTEEIVLKELLITCILISVPLIIVLLLVSIFLGNVAVRPVEVAWERQRQFVVDASHELKTPLTVILANSELIQSDDFSPQQKKSFAAAITEMSEQMKGLVEKLLDLTRVGEGDLLFTEVDFSSVVENAVLPFEPVFFEKGLSLECSIEPGMKVRGIESELRQLVDILLDNAHKYCYPDSKTEVKLIRQMNCCVLSVSEPGDELTEEENKYIFRRFYRGDRARAMNRSYGLGLPIAENIVLKHGGKIYAESSGGINTFSVQLPAAFR